MVKALILYTNGKFEEKSLKGYKEYQKEVGGYIESLPIRRSYANPSNAARKKLLCYVNEEGMMKQLASNPWTGLLHVLGVSFHPGMPLFGNVIVFQEGNDGDEANVDPYVLSLAKEYKECEDEDAFFVALEKLNMSTKRKAVAKPVQEEGEKKARTADCWCNDATKEETKTCVVITCASSVTRLMDEDERKAACPYHHPVKPVLFCGPCEYVCAKCIDIGWVSHAGTGGGDGLFNNDLNLKIVKGKLIPIKK